MTVEELGSSHYSIFEDRGIGNPNIEHTKLSIQFAIEVLESFDEHTQINDKIQELKQYLDEQ